MIEQAKRTKGMEELDENSICYWRTEDGKWLLHLPGVGVGGLLKHTVTENPDGTITVTPSVLMAGCGDGTGPLITRHGLWKEC